MIYWHVHHDVLVEPYSAPIEKRIEAIKRWKPPCEKALRLRLLKPVRGVLPPEVLTAAGKAEDAQEILDKLFPNADVTDTDYRKAHDHYAYTLGLYDMVASKHRTEIEVLHDQECPDCPWDGETIFPPQATERIP